MKDITVEAKVENIDVVTNFVNDILEENCCPMKIQMQIDVVIDEIFGNISYYAYGADGGKASVQAGIVTRNDLLQVQSFWFLLIREFPIIRWRTKIRI